MNENKDVLEQTKIAKKSRVGGFFLFFIIVLMGYFVYPRQGFIKGVFEWTMLTCIIYKLVKKYRIPFNSDDLLKNEVEYYRKREDAFFTTISYLVICALFICFVQKEQIGKIDNKSGNNWDKPVKNFILNILKDDSEGLIEVDRTRKETELNNGEQYAVKGEESKKVIDLLDSWEKWKKTNSCSSFQWILSQEYGCYCDYGGTVENLDKEILLYDAVYDISTKKYDVSVDIQIANNEAGLVISDGVNCKYVMVGFNENAQLGISKLYGIDFIKCEKDNGGFNTIKLHIENGKCEASLNGEILSDFYLESSYENVSFGIIDNILANEGPHNYFKNFMISY